MNPPILGNTREAEKARWPFAEGDLGRDAAEKADTASPTGPTPLPTP